MHSEAKRIARASLTGGLSLLCIAFSSAGWLIVVSKYLFYLNAVVFISLVLPDFLYCVKHFIKESAQSFFENWYRYLTTGLSFIFIALLAGNIWFSVSSDHLGLEKCIDPVAFSKARLGLITRMSIHGHDSPFDEHEFGVYVKTGGTSTYIVVQRQGATVTCR